MKIAGYIFTAIGGLALIGGLAAGHSVFGSLFWLALGIVLIYFGNKKEERNHSDKSETTTSANDNMHENVHEHTRMVSTNPEKVEAKRETTTYWEKYKSDNPVKASQVQTLLGIDFSQLSDKDAQEKINSVKRLCSQYNCEITDVKKRCLQDLEQFPLSFLSKMIEMTEKEKEQEALNFNIARENTVCAMLIGWMKERKEMLENSNVYNEHKEDDPADDQFTPEESFRKNYTNALLKRIGGNANNSLFCEGYDSPIAHELMDVMYAFLKDSTEKEWADSHGYGKRYTFIIIEETEKVTKQYCHAALQECIEHFNFPNKKVVTSFRCPYCGSWKVWDEDYGFECGECGCTWHAPLGYNLYLEKH